MLGNYQLFNTSCITILVLYMNDSSLYPFVKVISCQKCKHIFPIPLGILLIKSHYQKSFLVSWSITRFMVSARSVQSLIKFKHFLTCSFSSLFNFATHIFLDHKQHVLCSSVISFLLNSFSTSVAQIICFSVTSHFLLEHYLLNPSAPFSSPDIYSSLKLYPCNFISHLNSLELCLQFFKKKSALKSVLSVSFFPNKYLLKYSIGFTTTSKSLSVTIQFI